MDATEGDTDADTTIPKRMGTRTETPYESGQSTSFGLDQSNENIEWRSVRETDGVRKWLLLLLLLLFYSIVNIIFVDRLWLVCPSGNFFFLVSAARVEPSWRRRGGGLFCDRHLFIHSIPSCVTSAILDCASGGGGGLGVRFVVAIEY